MIRAGELNKRVQIQRRVLVPDSHGERGETWATIASAWAAVRPLSGSEYFSAEQTQARATHELRIRRFAGLTAGEHRIRFGQRVLNIEQVLAVEEKGEQMTLMCAEVVA